MIDFKWTSYRDDQESYSGNPTSIQKSFCEARSPTSIPRQFWSYICVDASNFLQFQQYDKRLLIFF
jgi:hypothetical protein